VSALDSTFAVTTNGISVPGLKVRRATTTVELRNGQSFAIAGLIQDDFNDSLKSLPGVGSIPIIGALLRSTNYQRNQTELVVFITVHLIEPGPQTNIALPTDRVVPPTPAEVIGLGHTEETRPPPPVPGTRSMNDTPAAPPIASSAPAVAAPAPTQVYGPPGAAPSTPVIVAPEKPVAQSPSTTSAPPPDVVVTPDKQSSATVTPQKFATAALPSPAAPNVTAAFDPIPIPKPKPTMTAAPIVKATLKSADATPSPRKLTLAAVKPGARVNAVKPALLPAPDEELPVTAPDSIKAFRAEQAAATQTDSNGTSAQ